MFDGVNVIYETLVDFKARMNKQLNVSQKHYRNISG